MCAYVHQTRVTHASSWYFTNHLAHIALVIAFNVRAFLINCHFICSPPHSACDGNSVNEALRLEMCVYISMCIEMHPLILSEVIVHHFAICLLMNAWTVSFFFVVVCFYRCHHPIFPFFFWYFVFWMKKQKTRKISCQKMYDWMKKIEC